MVRKHSMSLVLALAAVVLFQFERVESSDIPFRVLDIESISRYSEDRLVYQHIEKDISYAYDNSLSCLLIIKDRKMYLFKDGYDNTEEIKTQRLIIEMENRLISDLWVNKIDSKPDYVQITDRRVELMRNVSQEFVDQNFGTFYTEIRSSFIKKHVDIFKSLMIDRRDSGLFVERKPLPKRLYDTGPTKYSTTVTGKTIDEKIYSAEDADGDGITETFTVTIPDGFHWGYKSGPNIIFIYNNKQKDIEGLIGKLAHEAYYGTPEESENIKKTFPKKDDISDMIQDIYRTRGNSN